MYGVSRLQMYDGARLLRALYVMSRILNVSEASEDLTK